MSEMVKKKVNKIGVFDSGLGGMSLFPAMLEAFSDASFYYIADNAFSPYGDQSAETIIERAYSLVEIFLDWGAELIIIPCNTATMHSIEHLRRKYPTIPFVGVEPFVTFVQKITPRPDNFRPLFLLTPLAKDAKRFQDLLSQVDPTKKISGVYAPKGLARLIENDVEERGTEAFRQKVEAELRDIPPNTYTHVVLGCTHYPLIKEDIESVLKIPCVYPVDPIIDRMRTFLPASSSTIPGEILLANTKSDNRYFEKMLFLLQR